MLRGTYTDDGHERDTVKNQTSSLAGWGALPPQAVWRLAPYDDEPVEDKSRPYPPQGTWCEPDISSLTLCVFVGVDVHGNPHCVKIHGESARPCCVGLTRATVTNGIRREIKPRLSQGGAPEDVAPYKHEPGEDEKQTSSPVMRSVLPPQAVWRLAPYKHKPGEDEKQASSPGLSRSLRWGAGGVRHIFLSRKRQFSAIKVLWGFGGLSFKKGPQSVPLQRSPSAFPFSVPLQRSPKAFPPSKKGTLSDPFCYAFLNRQRPGRSWPWPPFRSLRCWRLPPGCPPCRTFRRRRKRCGRCPP